MEEENGVCIRDRKYFKGIRKPKTTFMRMVAGLAAPSEGSMELFGSKDLEKQRIQN